MMLALLRLDAGSEGADLLEPRGANGEEPGLPSGAGGDGERPLGARVLVVEDNTVNQKVATAILESLGCRAEVAANGREAIGMLELLPFDAVLMDIQMPDMDGYETTAEIRRRRMGAGGRVPIVAMTAQAMKGERERCLRAGMDGYVAKPVKPQEIRAALVRVLGDGADISPADGSSPEGEEEGAAPRTRFDRSRLDKMLRGDPSLIREILQMFIEDTAENLEKLAGFIDEGDGESAVRTAHALKGSAGNIGAGRFSEICFRIETSAREGRLEEALSSVEKAREEFDALREDFAGLLG
jgi:CheY-like chemotaxis protein/HPt (histidine-containing phosphotransfer) domain-containing protein